jgi:hypothetical protein
MWTGSHARSPAPWSIFDPCCSGAVDRPRVVVAAGLAVLLIAGVIIASLVFGSRGQSTAPPRPVALVAVPAPSAGSPDCAGLIRDLPANMQSGSTVLARAQLAEPAPPAAAAWAAENVEPVVLRCGLDRPAELTPTTQTRAVSGVQWLPIEGQGATTWYTVDRAVFVALTVPATAGTGPLQEISALIAKLPRKP